MRLRAAIRRFAAADPFTSFLELLRFALARLVALRRGAAFLAALRRRRPELELRGIPI
jgi:hypothetical protein